MPLLDDLLALVPLERLPRTGWLQAGVEPVESIAAHSLGTAFVTLALGPRVAPALDVDRAAALAVVHDVPEALLGDLPRAGAALLPPGAKARAEAAGAARLLAPLSELAAERFAEATARESREARFAALCDKLQLGVRLVGYVRAGWGGLDEFRTTLADLDCSEFEPCEELRRELLAAVEVERR
jgi:putative hydrolase of HD superfamily